MPTASGGANDLVVGINRQLGGVQTQAGGVAVRLRWDVDTALAPCAEGVADLKPWRRRVAAPAWGAR